MPMLGLTACLSCLLLAAPPEAVGEPAAARAAEQSLHPHSGQSAAWSATPDAAAVLATARGYLGTPYVWGGTRQDGLDCSGFIGRVFLEHGYDLPRVAREQVFVGLSVAPHAIQPGDLLFFADGVRSKRINHVGMYVADGRFIHASSGKGEVTYDRLATHYYRDRLRAVRRILALPPGRYSTAQGAAVAHALRGAAVDDIQPADVVDVSGKAGAPLQEEPSSLWLAALTGDGGLGAPVLTRVGPVALQERDYSTSLGLKLGLGTVDKVGVQMVAPQWVYFGPADSAHLIFSIPLPLAVQGEAAAPRALWQRYYAAPRDYSKIIETITLGRKGAPFYLDIGRTVSGTLAQGQLMRYHTPNIASASLPGYPLRPNALTLALDASLGRTGVEAFVDDVLAPQVVGASLSLRAGSPGRASGASTAASRGAPKLQLSYAADCNAPYPTRGAGNDVGRRVVQGAGATLTVPMWMGGRGGVQSFADMSALFHPVGVGVGGAAGLLLHWGASGKRAHQWGLRLEGRLSSPTFIPSYFDATYRLDRGYFVADRAARAAAGETSSGPAAATKLAQLEALADSGKRWSLYGEFSYQWQRRVLLAMAYEDVLGQHAAEQGRTALLGRNFMALLQLHNLYLPRSSNPLSFHLAYHLRNFGQVGPVLAQERTNEYLFAAMTLAATHWLSLGAGVRKALDQEAGAGTMIGQSGATSTVDGLVDVNLKWDL